METIGLRLKKLRESRKLSMGKLEEAVQVSRGSVNQWEKDKSIPGGKAIIALANFFNVSTDYILLGTENNQREVQELSEITIQVSATEYDFVQKLGRLNREERLKLEGIIDGILISKELGSTKKMPSSTLTNGEEAAASETA